ncbi:MAG TPA: hypothetical protein VKJ07_11845, partial [Mycobacteriales bacterium]|nr:hypothetical protein [Mycobacteriales bacterium]
KGWRRVASAASFRGTLSVSSIRGARLRLPQAHAAQVALLVRTCPTCGRLDIYRGGLLWRSVNTRSARPHTRVLLLQPPFSPRTMTLSLQVRTAGKPVYVDGVAVRHS